MDYKLLGDLGERIACEYLVDKGFKILEKNYKISFGEIDIIAKNKDIIHFVEVKTALDTEQNFFYPEERVNYKKQKKLRQMAEIWLQKNKILENHPYQIDIIGILIDKKNKKAKLRCFLNVVSD